MKKGRKITIWVLLGLALLGLALAGTGLAMGASPYLEVGPQGIRMAGGQEMVEGLLELRGFTDLTVAAGTADVELIPSDHYAVAYRVQGEEEIPDAQLQDGRLVLTQPGEQGFRINVGFPVSGQDRYIRVYYDAASALGEVELTLSCGDLTLEGVDAESIAVNASLGNVNYRGRAQSLSFILSCGDLALQAQADTLELDVSLGSVRMTDCSLDSVKGTLDCGDLTAGGGKIGRAELTLHMGDFTFDGEEIGNVTYQGSCGSCTVEGKLTGSNRFTLDMGDLAIRSTLPRDQYRLSLTCDMGEARVNGAAADAQGEGQAPHSVQAQVSSGNVTADFLS